MSNASHLVCECAAPYELVSAAEIFAEPHARSHTGWTLTLVLLSQYDVPARSHADAHICTVGPRRAALVSTLDLCTTPSMPCTVL